MIDRPFLYRRDGTPIDSGNLRHDLEEWARLSQDAGYRIVACDWIGPLRILTCWHGVNADYSPPAIFETTISLGDEHVWTTQHATEAEARTTHERLVRTFRPDEAVTVPEEGDP